MKNRIFKKLKLHNKLHNRTLKNFKFLLKKKLILKKKKLSFK